ncbi:MAG: CPBP family intramembrane glutamic endopeptidase [Gemmataceae bacterium]
MLPDRGAALAVGLLVMVGLMALGRKTGVTPATPTHPIVGVALTADWRVWLQVFVVAAIVAPVVEETFFRGALYRHLRDATAGLPRWQSVTVAVAASGFVFAVIHPQGWLGVPVLMALAAAFALARDWRGSVVAPILAHAINNGATTFLLLLLAG